jgi:hypothetical protein
MLSSHLVKNDARRLKASGATLRPASVCFIELYTVEDAKVISHADAFRAYVTMAVANAPFEHAGVKQFVVLGEPMSHPLTGELVCFRGYCPADVGTSLIEVLLPVGLNDFRRSERLNIRPSARSSMKLAEPLRNLLDDCPSLRRDLRGNDRSRAFATLNDL